MARMHRRTGARAATWLYAICAWGCASAPIPAPSAPPSASQPVRESAAPAAYDWHALIVVPFGTLLKDMPLALDEVILFGDAAGPAASRARSETESGDCFSIDGASPPRFIGRRPDSYLLCFEHDRLRRIEASLHLDGTEAERLLDALCAQWLGRAHEVPRSQDGCVGREGAVDWDVRRTEGPGSSATLSVTLIDARTEPRE